MRNKRTSASWLGRAWFSCALLICVIQAVPGFVNSPKIITKDGNLIFEAGLNRNISFRLSGKSRLNINDEFDLLDLILLSKKGRNGSHTGDVWADMENSNLRQVASESETLKLQAQDLSKRFRRLQNSTRTANQLLRRYQLRLQIVETKVQTIYDQLERDNCKSNPCENGGTCFNMFNGFFCKCSKNFEGPKCEKDVNECALFTGTDLGCQNGGQCVNQFGGYSCLCSPGWLGIHCTQRKGDCLQSSAWELCGHGTCVNSNDNFGYKCICDQGWKTNGLTPACTVDVDECTESHSPCVTQCINLPGSFTCAPCAAGLTGNGVSCRDVDECAAQNGGCSLNPRVPCINAYGSYHCGECPLGWGGDGRRCVRSSTNENGPGAGCAAANICHPDAVCSEISNTVVCSCPFGMIGSGIGVNGCVRGTARNCNSLPCLNGGTCIDSGTNYTCLCPIGFRAPNCTPLPSPCAPNPCHNSGRCRPEGGTQFQCQCSPGFTGRLCDKQFSRCGGVLAGDVGHVKYPTGSLYEHNAQCAWIIRTNASQVLNVTFNAFELEDSTECRFDWLQINDGRTAAAQIIGRFCGSHKPQGGNIISSTNFLYLWFRSDNSTSKEGFDLEWNSIPPQCGGIIEVESHGTIASPGSPGNYPKNRDCRWQLRAPNDKRIKLTFFSLQIETHHTCNFDFVEISDSISNVVLEKFCTSSHPTPLLLSSNEATIHFHSDSEGADTGFQIYYSIEERIPGCGGTFTAKEGTISSPIAAQESISCEYDVKMSPSESVTIEFVKMQLGQEDCIELYDVNAATQTVALQSKYCGSYGLEPELFHSLYSAVRIKYYSKDGGEFELKYKADCASTYESATDVIQSPSYPKLSNTDRICAYKIITEPNTVISLNIVDFDLKDNGLGDNDCADTYFQINDGYDTNELAPFCGNRTPPHDFVSKTNMISFRLQTGPTSFGRGFKIEYKAIPMGKTDCGGFFTKPGQSIRLPTGEDGLYAHDLECYWIILAPSDKHIVLSWKSFHLEESSDCHYDYIEIYDNLANSENARPLGRFCDTYPPPTFISHSRILTIKFVSDSSDATDGFEASYDFVNITNECGGTIFSSTGKLNSPDWPANYTNQMDCSWTIMAPPGTQIELQVDMFELEVSENCGSDWLEVRNGGSANSTLVGYFCGTSIPRTIPSFTHQMRLHFHSDYFLNARGFQIRWHVFSNGCGGNLKSELGVITSPFYPDPYPRNAECEWHVYVSKGSSIHFTVEDLAMEDLFHCSYDSLEIFDGHRIGVALPLIKMCNLDAVKSTPIVTDSNEAVIRFQTDSTSNERGFLLSYYANCTRTIIDIHGVIESPNYGDPNYKNDINCTWTIEAPLGNTIALEFTYFDNFERSSEITFTELTSNASIIKEHTIKHGRSFNSTTTILKITQTSNLVSFRLEYSMVGCIGVFHRDSGEFHSPNFPKTYPNNIECMWEIKTVPGQGIELTIEDMDIEESVNCTLDSLQISSYVNSDNPKERHCGKRDKLIITSSSHLLYVRFFSNAAHNGKGFNATYRVQQSPCGGVYSSKNGVLQSPNYPLNYPPNLDCEWTIEVTAHHTITLTMEELDLEDYYDCEMDYVEAYDGDDEDEENKLFRKCTELEEAVEWRTTTNTALVRFKSDESREAKGFKLSFKENCGERILIDETQVSYLEVSRTSQSNETCLWQIIASDPSKHVVFEATHVQLSPLMAMSYQTEADCNEIGAKIYDGSDDKSPVRSKFCKTHPPAIISNGHALTIKVPLNVISEFEGYYMIMDNSCGGVLRSITGKFSSPYYPSSYPVNIECEWYIDASAGNAIVLTIESLDLEDSEGCNNDYVEVRQGNERGNMLGLFCGTTLPESVKAVNSLWIKFKSDNDVVGGGFIASYNYVTHNEINGTNGTIKSPKYPTKFHVNEPYTWRITVDREFGILLTIKHIVDVDIPFIKFYDGYSEIGAEIEYSNTHIVRSNINILYLTASRGPFHFEWEQLSKEAIRSNISAEAKSQLCGNQLIVANERITFNSPGYPGGYSNNLECSWTIMPSSPSKHAVLLFTEIDLEEFNNCFADYVTISASNDLQTWRELEKLCKKETSAVKKYNGTPYLKLDLVTDPSINKTGFSSYISTACGSEMTDRAGFVNITELAQSGGTFLMDCVWTIRVRQGRRIRITFIDTYLRNSNDTGNICRTYFLVRNGIDEDSPFLGKGKYCDNDITDVLHTSSNRAYVKFTRMNFGFNKLRAAFQYEEINHECSDEIHLSDDSVVSRMKTITSPNYPNIPNPHTECIWKIIAPTHHVIAIDFVGHFDLAPGSGPIANGCDREYVQLNDGGTEQLLMMGRYCGTVKPDSISTTGNILRIKYFSDISEPHAGFMANVSIGRCGGAYYTSEGVITSPTSLTLRTDDVGFECVYTIELEQGNTINLKVEEMNLPTSMNCSEVTHLEFQEIDTYGGADNITDMLRICGYDYEYYIVETNKLVIRYKIKGAFSASNSFKISYSAVGARCGETIVASLGVLQTPGYPGGVRKPTHCSWRVLAPKGKRIKIEFLDFDTGSPVNSSTSFGRRRGFRGRLSFANDFQMQSIIARFSNNPPAQLYSTDNTMAIDAFLISFNRHRGFKLRFSAEEDSVECRNNFDLTTGGTLKFHRNNDTVVYCSYHLKVEVNQTLALHIDKYVADASDYMSTEICAILSPLILEINKEQISPQLLCRNDTRPSVRLPFPATFTVSGNNRNKLRELELRYKMYQCGGVRSIYPMYIGENLTVTQPDMGDHSGVLECAWAVWPNDNVAGEVEDMESIAYWMDLTQLEISLTTDFKGKCEDQYLLIYNGPNQNSPHLGRYCNQASALNLVVEHGLFFEYYSSNYEKQSTFNLTVKQGSGCGGKLTYPYRTIIFADQYKNNVECIWEITTGPGFHLGLSFDGRFFIESSADCKKDYLQVEEKNLKGEWRLLQKICGREPPRAVNTTFNEMRLIFRSDGDTVGDGFTAHFQRNCGGILYGTNEPQQISSPGYPKMYDNFLTCNYTILPQEATDAGVLVRFLDFQIEEAPISNCLFDNVTIYARDEYDNVEETVLCGVNKTSDYRAKASLSVVLRTDHSFTTKGFLLEYSNNVCGGLITNATIIQSPHQHGLKTYPPSTTCTWNLTAPEGHKILVKFEELDFESQAQCYFDGVEVFKGLAPVDDQRMAKFCGNLTGKMPVLNIPSNKGLIRSVSDSRDESRGFKALVSFIPDCDEHIFLGASNSTYEFNKYNGGYPNNLDCSYVFHTSPDRQLFVDFSSFHVEDTASCQDDYLEVRDGSGAFADSIGTFCGHDIPTRLMSSRNSIFMRFVTDAEGTSSGFTAKISSSPLICGQHNLKIEDNGKVVLKSPEGTNGGSPKNLNCFWIISAEKGIHIKFDKLDVGGANQNGTCTGNLLKIHNAEDESAIENGYGSEVVFNGHLTNVDVASYATEYVYCGRSQNLPDDYFSRTNKVFIKFQTDSEGIGRGYQLTAMANSGCFRNFTGTQGRILLADTTDHCDIYINAPQNYSLSLYYAEATFSEYDCNNEYIEVFDAHTNTSLQKVCSYTEPGKSLFTSTNALRLRIKMNGFYTQYDMTYLASTSGPGCGGDLYNTAGLITNPFYPNNVRNNSECSWNIRVPSNVHVLLNIEVFDLGSKSTCHSDYLQIIEFNKANGVEKVVRQFCGEDHPQIYKSDGNYLTVRFHKTVNYDGTGWVIRFSGVHPNYKIPEYYLTNN